MRERSAGLFTRSPFFEEPALRNLKVTADTFTAILLAMPVIAAMGHEPGHPDDPVVLIAGAVLDHPFLKGPVAKDRREDIQILDCLRTLSLVGSKHPFHVRPGDDPPDRIVEASGEAWAVELTELTVEDFRGDLARMRRLGRDLEDALRASDAHLHLKGRVVQLSNATAAGTPLPDDLSQYLDQLVAALAEDKGFLGEGADLSEGIPERLGDRGMYGEVGPFSIDVGGHGAGGVIAVASTPQAELRQSELVEALAARVAAKDHRANELLVVSCGLPDQRGYVCQVDNFIFDALWKAAQPPAGPLIPEPTDLAGVILHNFGGNLLPIYRRRGAPVPWA